MLIMQLGFLEKILSSNLEVISSVRIDFAHSHSSAIDSAM